jgi:PBP1b-binding outer membrane lipoprotein LpoB
MKIINTISAVAAFGGLLMATGCASTQIYDPTADRTNIRDTRRISQEEMREVARAAVQNALVAPKLARYVEKFRADNGGRNPVLKLDRTINDTNDPDLNTSVISDVLFEELLNSDKVEVTMAEGQGRTQAIGNSRLNVYDDNFNKATVAKTGTLVAANLVMRPKIVSQETRDGRNRNIERFFVMDMAEIDNGLIMWKYSKSLGFVTTRGAVGW